MACMPPFNFTRFFFWVLGEEPPQGRVRKTFVFSSRRVPVPIVFGVGSLVSPLVDATPYPLTFVFLACCVGPAFWAG